MDVLGLGIRAVEGGWVPDRLVRQGIRRLCRRRLRASEEDANTSRTRAFLEELRQGPIALVPEKANQQHYELPAAFFQHVLGPRLKYSSCYFAQPDTPLAKAEDDALRMTCAHAELRDGQRILELGCGWGSLSMWMASQYPAARITAVSNSASQRAFIEQQCRIHDIGNLRVLTADMNDFEPADKGFDRVVSVEMFEHMRNFDALLARIASWLDDRGKLFVHIFCHKEHCYPFQTNGSENWMGRYFFTGGIMPNENLLRSFERDMVIEQQYRWNGRHYRRTLEVWLENMDNRFETVLQTICDTYGNEQGKVWFNRWRIFFMACAELFGFDDGEQWFVSHYRLKKAGS